MKNRIFTLMLGILAFGFVNAQTTIFDPSTYAEGSFQNSAAMNIVSIDGTNYLKVELNGWNTTFQVSETVLDDTFEKFTAEAKFEEGTSGFTVSQVNTFVKLVDNTSQDFAEMSVAAAASTADFSTYTGSLAITADINTVTTVQLAGQETAGWSAVAGDFIYVGKILAIKKVVPEPVSISTKQAKSLNVYPNPASSIINIDMVDAVELEIYNIIGAKVVAKQLNGETSFDISSLDKGVYVLKVTNASGKAAVAKFNKE